MKTLVLSALATLAIATAAQADSRMPPAGIDGDAALNGAMGALAGFIANRREADAIYAGLAAVGTEATDVPAFMRQADALPADASAAISTGRDLDRHLAAFNADLGAEEPAMFRLQYAANAALADPVRPAGTFGTAIHDGQTLERNLAELEDRMIQHGGDHHRETVATIGGRSFDRYVAALALY